MRCSENIKNTNLQQFGLSEATLTKMMEGNLSQTIVHLDIFLYTSNSLELVKVLMALNQCSQLRDLTLDWKLYDGFYIKEPFCNPDFQVGQSFKSLQWLRLTFDADTQFLQGKNSSCVFKTLDEVLLQGFKVPELKLRFLGLYGGNNIKKVSGTEGFVLSEDILDRLGLGHDGSALYMSTINKWLFKNPAAWSF